MCEYSPEVVSKVVMFGFNFLPFLLGVRALLSLWRALVVAWILEEQIDSLQGFGQAKRNGGYLYDYQPVYYRSYNNAVYNTFATVLGDWI